MMAKLKAMPLAWHEDCLGNWRATLAHNEAELARMQQRVDDSRRNAEFYRRQIDEARRQGKSAFDRERFLKPK